jgi:hypothetical protein
MARSRTRKRKPSTPGAPVCGLCGKRGKLTRTPCCGNWICDDKANYQVFSYARTSCFRNHSHYTLCAYHDHEDHEGEWQDCQACRDAFPGELYVYHGTNEYNFVKLENPPSFEPSHCDKCGAVVSLVAGGYSRGPEGLLCESCLSLKFPKFPRE